MTGRDALKYFSEILVAIGTYFGFIWKISPPEEIRNWQSSAAGIASLILLIIFLFLASRKRTDTRYRWRIGAAGLICLVLGTGLFFRYRAETDMFTFVFPPGGPNQELYVKGTALTDDAAKWKNE